MLRQVVIDFRPVLLVEVERRVSENRIDGSVFDLRKYFESIGIEDDAQRSRYNLEACDFWSAKRQRMKALGSNFLRARQREIGDSEIGHVMLFL